MRPMLLELISKGLTSPPYTFEYYMNVAYAFNRDRGNCRICREPIWPGDLQVHHLNPKLPTEQVNKVSNLASLHKECHRYLHHPGEIPFKWDETGKATKKLFQWREKL
ncbi:MAG: HNH endonuclease [Firmicutes bacterium]|nr:HNH endonuclease [Bacillota bacterium]